MSYSQCSLEKQDKKECVAILNLMKSTDKEKVDYIFDMKSDVICWIQLELQISEVSQKVNDVILICMLITLTKKRKRQ